MATIQTRIISKHADLAALNSSSFIPKDGEIVFAKVTSYTNNGTAVPTYLMKVGDGQKTFANLQWAGAQALDVFKWAKQENFPVKEVGTGAAIGSIAWVPAADTTDADGAALRGGYLKVTKADIATAAELGALTTRVNTAETDIDNLETRMGTAESDIDKLETSVGSIEDLIETLATKKALEDAVTDLEGQITTANEQATSKANTALADAKTYADGLNTAMDTRVKVLEGIDHDAYKAADTALETKITGAYEAADNAVKDAFAAADTAVKTELIGATGSTKTSNTIAGAKLYADDVAATKAAAAQAAAEATAASALSTAVSGLETKIGTANDAISAEATARENADNALDERIDSLESTITALEGTTHFVGVKTSLPTEDMANGDICIVGTKEYVYDAAQAKWVELGDTSAEQERLTKVEKDVSDIKSDYALTSTVNTELGKKAEKEHTHAQADVTGLAEALAGKANAEHGHTQDEIDGLENALEGKVDVDTYNSAMSLKADKTALEAEIARATKAEGDNTTLINGVDARLQTAEGEITQLKTDVSNRYTKGETNSAISDAVSTAKTQIAGTTNDASTAATIAGAKKYAEEKAAAAQTAAVNAAASDATSKANTAEANAKAYVDSELDAHEATYTADKKTFLTIKDGKLVLDEAELIIDCGGIETV